MNKVTLTVTCMLLLSFLIIGCATVVRGTHTIFQVYSEPSGARVETSFGNSYTTPASIKVERKPGFSITVSKSGYQTEEIMIESKVSGGGTQGLAGNILLGGVVGAAVDAKSGAMRDLSPNPVHVKLVPLTQGVVEEEKP